MIERRKYLIPEEWLSKPRIVSGLMSGTSLDGVDAALVKFWNFKGKHKFKLIDFQYLPFKSDFKKAILNVINSKILISEVSSLNFQLADYFIKAIDLLLSKNKVKRSNVDLIGMHGQTVWHEPPNKNKLSTQNSQLPTTLQLGSAPVLCHNLNIPVISDFRSADVALGGQGAPLVPIFDREFLSDKMRNVIALNIGGISNITYLPMNGDVIAIDTGPGNVLIDTFSKTLFRTDFDNHGSIAVSGKFSEPLFNYLTKIKYIKDKPPKSTGRELFDKKLSEKIIQIIRKYKIPKNDVIFTLTQFTAWSIAVNIRLFADEHSRVVVSGGGANNLTLLKLLRLELPKAEIICSDDIGIDSDAKEAICFAYLAWRNIANLPGNIKTVTGARKEIILGSLTLP
ncbi:MAG: anhydro-N-acetylmuramic acid kinase [bacterium]